MALRATVYVGLLWQHIVKEKQLAQDGRLPPVFPVVHYNGDPAWVMPVSLDALIGLPAESPLWRWQPRMRYLPRSRENPKILWVDDSEVVRDSVAVGVPIPRHVVAQEGQHCDAEILEAGVALVVGDVPVHQPP